MNLRLTTRLTLTITLTAVAFAAVSVYAADYAWRQLSKRPDFVALPRGGCDVGVDLATVEDGRLTLSGPVDTRDVDRVRQAATAVWWTAAVDDRLVATDCGRCERRAEAVEKAFAPTFVTGKAELERYSVTDGAAVAQFMAECPLARIDIVGYADSRWALSSDLAHLQRDYGVSFNDRLSAARADTVRSLLAATVDPQRILSAKGEGFTDRFNSLESDTQKRSLEQLRLNRTARVSFSFAPIPARAQWLGAPSWITDTLWQAWLLATAAGVAVGFGLAAFVSWVLGLADAEAPNQDNRLIVIEGIGPHFAARIESVVGIRSIPQLADATDVQLDAIAGLHTSDEFPPVGRPKADAWAAMARLIQLPMVTKDWAELLVAAGVTKVTELADMSPALLRTALAAANVVDTKTGQRKLAPWLPSVVELDYLIKVARDEVTARRLRQRADRRVSAARVIRLAIRLISKLRGHSARDGQAQVARQNP